MFPKWNEGVDDSDDLDNDSVMSTLKHLSLWKPEARKWISLNLYG